MPKQKDIVAGKHTREELRSVVIEKTIETHKPYKEWKDPDSDDKLYLIVYTSPLDQSRRKVMTGIPGKKLAKDMVKLLERGWAEGYITSIRDFGG